jgi:GNAT superfamily N-acetyltransferase
MRRKTKQQILRDLGNGLILRRAAPADAEALAEFSARTLGEGDSDGGNFVRNWTRDLMSGKHPTFKPGDFTVVEDTAKGEIVSSLNLFSQRWSYGGVEFDIGRPELVSTNPDYRKRGLIRAQFDVIHEWSRQRGHPLQAITGIPYFYRQFGYEMALELDASRNCHRSSVPKLKEGDEEPYRVRLAAEADLPFLARTYTQGMSRSLVSSVISPKLWRYYVFGRALGERFSIIESPKGERLGILIHHTGLHSSSGIGVLVYELKAGVSWLAVQPSVLRYFARTGVEYAAQDKKDFEWIRFHLGTDHPFYQSAPDFLAPRHDPYAFYIRVPDLPAFLRHIAPVLEERLAKSVAIGWSGELKLSFYRDGLRLALKKGKLTAVEPWSPSQGGESACFRDLTFLQVLFGLHSPQELRAANPDCGARGNDAQVLLGILFPKQASGVWAVA